jgi:hypothetical protein
MGYVVASSMGLTNLFLNLHIWFEMYKYDDVLV